FGSPNSPTGTLVKLKDIKNFANEKDSPFIFIDESFLDFRRDKDVYETLALAEKLKKIFTIRSLTKFYSMPGLRLGFGVGHKILIKKLNTAKDIWNVNLLALKAGRASLYDENYKKNTLNLIENEKNFLSNELQKLNIKIFPPTVNFILCYFENIGIAENIRNILRERGFLVRNCENYPGLDGRYIRIAVKNRKDNEALIAALREISVTIHGISPLPPSPRRGH
ncbi:MAG: aminotransferase class I/II-fold pyridoxal phosphate-dependent enzyme, partial [Selenomonadaceae bacterium]|nr:aminotransferase class I/II-fold pyridoxal phosphate-dependent enzyme [Selenomonadaceae bacterium]